MCVAAGADGAGVASCFQEEGGGEGPDGEEWTCWEGADGFEEYHVGVDGMTCRLRVESRREDTADWNECSNATSFTVHMFGYCMRCLVLAPLAMQGPKLTTRIEVLS